MILRSPVLIINVGSCFTGGARSRLSCGWWGRRGRWKGGGAEGMNKSYVMDGWEDNDVRNYISWLVVFTTLADFLH